MYFNNLGNIITSEKITNSNQIREKIEIVKSNLNAIVEKKDIVGIFGPRTEDTIIVILACLEQNITFIPMDTQLPEERIRYMIKDAGVKLLINGVIKSDEKCFAFGVINISYKELYKRSFKTSDKLDMNEENPAYILYTSGTTGRPKGVIIPYIGLENFLNAIPQRIPFEQCRRVSCFTSFSFDISLMEIVLGLMSGLDLVLATDEERNNPRSLIGLIERYNIEMLQMTPSMLRLLQVYNGSFSFLKNTKILMIGGEKLTNELLIDVKRDTNCRVFNMYGPTETTIWSTVSDLSKKTKSDIGTPIEGTTIYIVDENNKLVEKGNEGELLIGGKGVADGYINCPELTNEKFITVDYIGKERVYRTGDICKYDNDGNLVFISRKDSQIKYNGHRIELSEIEYCVNELQMTQDNCVCFDGKDIICFYLGDDYLENGRVKEKLSRILPEYMVPNQYIKVDKFEYTISKKIDREKLIEKYRNQQTINMDIIDANCMNIKEKVIHIISPKAHLSSSDLETEKKFDELGLDSVEFIEMVVELEDCFEIEFDEEFLNINMYHTLQDLIDYIDSMVSKQNI